jgi:starch synthase
MGASGAARARELYDWKVVVRAYEELWARLAELRRSAGGAPLGEPAAWPGRPDPFELFASFPSSVISDRHRVRIPAGIGEREALARLGVRVSMLDLNPEIPPSAVLGLWRSLGPDPRTVETVVDAQSMLTRSGALRALLILAKAGLVEIGAP